ncbi:MAG: thiamine ABC transporter substrate-binding protein [Acidimicrobiales bacterium]
MAVFRSKKPWGMRFAALLVPLTFMVTACSDDGGDDDGGLTIVTHDSFNVSDEVLAAFTDDTGIDVEILRAGDAGAALNQAILTKDDPEGDVFFGVDNTFLTRALDEDLFVAYEPAGLADVDPAFVLDPEHHVTPIDYGDVCLNYDKDFFAAAGAPPLPQTLDQLTDPAYRDLLVVENPATSSPGLAFLLATIEHFGVDGWTGYWSALRANGVTVIDAWPDAYYGQFSGGSGEGDKPLVVSYASSPPAEVQVATGETTESPTGVLEQSCFRQVEFAGILQGTEHEEDARRLIDFMLSLEFQEDMPLTMYVFPVNREADLPEVFVQHAVVPDAPFQMPPDEIGEHRDEWIQEWTDTVLR